MEKITLLRRWSLASLAAVALLSISLAATPALAQGDPYGPPPVPPDSGTVTLPNPLGNSVTPAELAGRIIKTLLGLSGAAALVVFVYGGMMFMFSGGNAQRVLDNSASELSWGYRVAQGVGQGNRA
jgi:hypothetical protein